MMLAGRNKVRNRAEVFRMVSGRRTSSQKFVGSGNRWRCAWTEGPTDRVGTPRSRTQHVCQSASMTVSYAWRWKRAARRAAQRVPVSDPTALHGTGRAVFCLENRQRAIEWHITCVYRLERLVSGRFESIDRRRTRRARRTGTHETRQS